MTRERRAALEARLITARKAQHEPALFTSVRHTKGQSWRGARRAVTYTSREGEPGWRARVPG